MLQGPSLYVAVSEKKGRGVFTANALRPGDVIELCPVLIIPADEVHCIDKTVLYNYYFLWPEPTGSACIPLGLGALYNHSPNPNAEVEPDLEQEMLIFKCIRPIGAGDEICIDYTNGGKGQLWFEEE